VEAHDVPDRLIPPTWSPAQVICTAFASAAAAAGLLGTVTTGRLISLGLVVFSLLTFVVVSARIPPRRIMGPYLVLSGTTLLQLSLLCRSDVSASLSHDGLLSPDCAYGVAGTAAVVLGCAYCRVALSRHHQAFFGASEVGGI